MTGINGIVGSIAKCRYFFEGVKQHFCAAARKIGSSDRRSEQCVAGKEDFFRFVLIADRTGRMTGCVKHGEFRTAAMYFVAVRNCRKRAGIGERRTEQRL